MARAERGQQTPRPGGSMILSSAVSRETWDDVRRRAQQKGESASQWLKQLVERELRRLGRRDQNTT